MTMIMTQATTTTSSSVPIDASTQHVAHQILDLLIIGGGLSGLFVAHDYHHRHQSREITTTTTSKPTAAASLSTSTRTSSTVKWKLLEARSVLGGRLVNDNKGHWIELGGAWVWPQQQPNLRHLLPQLALSTFSQPEDDNDDDRNNNPSSSTLRVDGGTVALIETLARNLPLENIDLNTPVTKCTLVGVEKALSDASYQPHYVQVETKTTIDSNKNNDNTHDLSSTTSIFRARRVVIALPPKLILKHIQFDPPLSLTKQQAMEASHTWMAGVTKIALVYPTQIWRKKDHNPSLRARTNMGLPTHWGPAFQVYDASSRDGTVAAVTFFAWVKANSPAQFDDQVLAKQVTQQLARVWDYLGVDKDVIEQLSSYSFTDIHVQRWPLEEYISEDSSPEQIHPHPHPVEALSMSEWQGALLFAGSESDMVSPGVMEGDIGAAFRVLRDIP
jgi:monoamine oxidase